MNTSKAILLRHAHTDHNGPPKIFQGRLDVGLSERGKQQCIDQRRGFDWVQKIVASPAKRVRQTLQYIFEERLTDIDVRFDEDLWEIDNGWFSGMPEKEVEAKDPDLYEQWCEAPHLCRPGGGETLSEMQIRAKRAIMKIANDAADNSRILVATHGGVVRVLTLDALSRPLSDFHGLSVDNLDTYELSI